MTWSGTKDAAKAGAEDGNERAEGESSVFDLDDSGQVGIALEMADGSHQFAAWNLGLQAGLARAEFQQIQGGGLGLLLADGEQVQFSRALEFLCYFTILCHRSCKVLQFTCQGSMEDLAVQKFFQQRLPR